MTGILTTSKIILYDESKCDLLQVLIYTDEILLYGMANPNRFKGEATMAQIPVDKYHEYVETNKRFIAMQTELWQLAEAGRSKNYGTGTS